jgi:hypothetical protein
MNHWNRIAKKELAILGLAGVIGLTAVYTSSASSHREAPLISEDPVADATDLYAFISPDAPDKLTLIGNWIPFEEPAGGPSFYRFSDDVLYTFHIDNNGDGVADISYELRFKTLIKNPNTSLYSTGPITAVTNGSGQATDYTNLNIQQSKEPRHRSAGRAREHRAAIDSKLRSCSGGSGGLHSCRRRQGVCGAAG